MRFSILSITLLVFLLVCQACFTTAFSEPKNNNMMRLPRDGEVLVARAVPEAAPAQPPVKRKARAPTIWASPEILQNGTLFYIAISISTLLWCTGKGVDMSLDQQERRAEYMARR